MRLKTISKFGTNFRHTAGWFLYVFLRDGPGSGHCLYKQRNTPKQTRLRKTLLHYFWQSLRRKGQQGSVIVSALKIGFASRPIFSKVMLSSDKKLDHCLNASLLCLLILREHWQGAIYTQHKHQTTHERLHAWPSPNFDKSQSNHKAPPETPYPVTKVSCQILMKYFMMFAPIIWLWASISFAWIFFCT